MAEKVLVAMSGGVDSSVAAYLLQQQGYACIGVTMRLYENETAGIPRGHTCCSLDDVEDARAVAYDLGMPYYVLNFTEEFDEKVIRKFVQVYQNGGTPNPCIDCNRYLKFDHLLNRARELGCDYIATGHYVQRWQDESGRWGLRKNDDPGKDQSYVLYSLTQDQLAHTLFPLGGMHKDAVRAIAEEQGLCNARKHDSQDICFVPDGDYAAFLERYTGQPMQPGNFVDEQGHVIGRHKGAARYTIGQRKGLGLAMGAPVYVCGKDMEKNTVSVGPEAALFSDTVIVDDMNWISIPELTEPIHIKAKIRYRHPEQPCEVTVREDGTVSHAAPSTVTGAALMASAPDQKAGWEFLKWWTSAEIQSSYGRDLESVVGSAARYNTANQEALNSVQWDYGIKQQIKAQAAEALAVPEAPGGYFTSRQFDFAFRNIAFYGDNTRTALEEAAQAINKELSKKQKEFGLTVGT